MTTPRYSVDDFNDIPQTHTDARSLDSWQPYYLSDTPDAESHPPSLGHNLIYPGLRHIFSGPPESAKTLAAYAVGIDIIRNVPRATVLLMDFEMGPKAAKRRWRYAGATDTELDQQILYLAPEQPAKLERIEILVAMAPTLVIIDAAAGAFDNEGLDDNKRADAERWRKLYVDPFFDHGIATIVIDHVVKNVESRGKYTIGSERKIGGGEVHIGFDTIKPVKRGSTGIYKMILHRDREGHFNRGHIYDLHVSSDPDTHTLSCEFRPIEHTETHSDVWMPTILMEKISAVLQKLDEPISRNQLELSVNGKNDHKRDAIDHLVRLGYATETHGARNAKLYSNLRNFTVAEWEANDLAPTSPPPRPGEVTAPRPSTSPPTGDGRGDGAKSNGQPRPQDDDPEVQAMLAHYNLLEHPDPEPAKDDELPT